MLQPTSHQQLTTNNLLASGRLTKHGNRYKLRLRNMLRALGATWRANDSLRCLLGIAPDRG